MSDMIERVAAALEILPIRDNENRGGELDRLRLREAARAAIKAMREPTEAMIDVGGAFCDSNAAWRAWQATIDAALSDVI